MLKNQSIAIITQREMESNSLSLENHFFVPMDITSKTSIAEAISQIHNRYGKIDALANSAYPCTKNWRLSLLTRIGILKFHKRLKPLRSRLQASLMGKIARDLPQRSETKPDFNKYN